MDEQADIDEQFMDERLYEYRQTLISLEEKAQVDYDKLVISLSGGAIGISFAFIKNIVGDGSLTNTYSLFAAWIAWGVSVTCVMASHFFSQKALRKTIEQVDNDTIYEQSPGGYYTSITNWLSVIGGLLFVVGLILMVVFISNNLSG